jgi:dihydroorotase
LLAEVTGARVHCQHISAAGSVRIIREAKARGVPISGEVCPHHIALTDESIKGYDTSFKMNPPLRTKRDIEALLEGVVDGTLEFLSSDHAPHCEYEKEVEFDFAPFGIVGLETELGLFLTHLYHAKILSLPEVIRRMTIVPARYLGLNAGTLEAGKPADITVMDPDLEWMVNKNNFLSKSRNTPFHGTHLKGRAVTTIVDGQVVWELNKGLAPGL